MTYIYNDDLSNPIENNAQWCESNGTTHPSNEPKAGVPSMVLVDEGTMPDVALNHVLGTFTVQLVGGVPTKVWGYTPKTAQELKDEANDLIINQINFKERMTDGRVRELTLRWAQATLSPDDADRVALETHEAELAALRAQLQQ